MDFDPSELDFKPSRGRFWRPWALHLEVSWAHSNAFWALFSLCSYYPRLPKSLRRPSGGHLNDLIILGTRFWTLRGSFLEPPRVDFEASGWFLDHHGAWHTHVVPGMSYSSLFRLNFLRVSLELLQETRRANLLLSSFSAHGGTCAAHWIRQLFPASI